MDRRRFFNLIGAASVAASLPAMTPEAEPWRVINFSVPVSVVPGDILKIVIHHSENEALEKEFSIEQVGVYRGVEVKGRKVRLC